MGGVPLANHSRTLFLGSIHLFQLSLRRFPSITVFGMLSSAFFVLALLGHASCAPSFDVRDTTPTDTDLLLSCPGAAGTFPRSQRVIGECMVLIHDLLGSPNVRDADRCTLINIVNNPDVRPFVAIGDAQLKYV